MKLSNNFTLEELTISETAARQGIDNTPDADVVSNLTMLCGNILEPLRASLGGKPISITSGYRSPKTNEAIGGVATSQHCFGQAADIHVSGMTTEELFLFITEKTSLPFDQVIQEFNQWVHVSYRANPRGQKLRATHEDGKTVYTAVA